MAKELVIRNGFLINYNGTESTVLTGVTTDLTISATINQLASASAIKSYVDSVAASTNLKDLDDVSIISEQSGNTLVYIDGFWRNTGVSYFYTDLDNRYVNTDGDTMTGTLTVPTLTATTVNSTNGNFSNLTGTTGYINTLYLQNGTSVNNITTTLTNPGDNSTLATTSAITSYVQSELSNFSTTLSGLTDTAINNPLHDDILVYSGGTSKWYNTGSSYLLGNYYTKTETDNRYVNVSGDTMTGSLILGLGADLTLNDGNLQVLGNASILGNFYVSGTTTYINVQNMNVADNIILINSGETGSGVTEVNAGIKVDRGVYDPYYFIFNETTETFRIGSSTADETQLIQISGDTQAVATREDNPIVNGIAIWNSTKSRFDTTSLFTWNTGTSTLNVTGNITTNGTVDGVDVSNFYSAWLNFTGTTNTLDNLLDVTITSASSGDTLVYSGGSWINQSPVDIGDLGYITSGVSDLRYVLKSGDTMTGTLQVPTLTATTVNSTNGNFSNLTGTTINSTNLTVSGGSLSLTYGISVNAIASTTGSTPNASTTLLTEDIIMSLVTGKDELSELEDVNIVNPQLNDILVYDGSSKWVNTGQSYLDNRYVNTAGDTMTGNLTITPLSGTGDRLVYVDSNGLLKETNEYVYKPTTVTAGAGTTEIDSFNSALTYGTVWHYYVKSSTNTDFRSGIITGTWGAGSAEMNETSTRDIGSTSNVSFDLVLSGSDVKLNTTVITGSWNIKAVRMII